MSTLSQNTLTQNTASVELETLSTLRKGSLIVYGVFSYMIGCAGLVAQILAMAGIIPMGSLLVFTDNNIAAIVVNILLIGLFGVQHSVMARPFFKQAFRKAFGYASERATFVWGSGLVTLVIVGLWQPVTGTLWHFETGVGLMVMWGLFLLGWGYLFAATFAINHWDLFGLRQVWFAVQDQPYCAPEFRENWMYRYSRHPIMLGALIGLWCVPEMTATKFVMTALFTLYIFIGVSFEEKDLIREFGDRYLQYKNRVGMFFSWK